MREIIKTKTLDEWVTLFKATDACLDPVLTLSEVLGSPLVKGRKMVVEVHGAGANTKDIMNSLTDSEIEEFAKTGLFRFKKIHVCREFCF